VAIDFSPGARRALEAARALARRSGAQLTIAHARPTSDMRAAVGQDRGDLLKPGSGSLSRRLGEHYSLRLADWVRPRRGEEVRLLKGSPDVALTREARRGYDLIVLGSHGLGSVPPPLMGSTVERVLARAPVPVLVVPLASAAR